MMRLTEHEGAKRKDDGAGESEPKIAKQAQEKQIGGARIRADDKQEAKIEGI